MEREDLQIDDTLVAAVLSTGIRLGLVERTQVVAWADWLIERCETAPPPWLIELSLSQDLHLLDVLSILDRRASGADRAAVCRAIYGFIQPPAAPGVDQAEVFANRLYEITFECLGPDWTCQLLREADDVADAFQFIRDGDLNITREQAAEDARRFFEENRDDRVQDLLDWCVRRRDRAE